MSRLCQKSSSFKGSPSKSWLMRGQVLWNILGSSTPEPQRPKEKRYGGHWEGAGPAGRPCSEPGLGREVVTVRGVQGLGPRPARLSFIRVHSRWIIIMAATIFQTVAASLRLPHEVYRRWVPFFPPSQKQVESRTPAPGVLPWSEPEVSALRLLV